MSAVSSEQIQSLMERVAIKVGDGMDWLVPLFERLEVELELSQKENNALSRAQAMAQAARNQSAIFSSAAKRPASPPPSP